MCICYGEFKRVIIINYANGFRLVKTEKSLPLDWFGGFVKQIETGVYKKKGEGGIETKDNTLFV